MADVVILKRKGGVGALPGITQRLAVAKSVLCGQSIAEYEPDSEAARELPESAANASKSATVASHTRTCAP